MPPSIGAPMFIASPSRSRTVTSSSSDRMLRVQAIVSSDLHAVNLLLAALAAACVIAALEVAVSV